MFIKFPSQCFRWLVLVFKLLVPHSRTIKATMGIRVGDIADRVVDLLDLGLGPAVAIVVRVLGMVVQGPSVCSNCGRVHQQAYP